MKQRARSLAIVGVGLIGASLALAWRGAFSEIVGIDANREHREFALANGIVDRTDTDPLSALAADVVVVAVPVDAAEAVLDGFARAAIARMPELIIDVASLQRPFTRFGALLPTFVSTHPMAGSERSGPAAADRQLFYGRTWLVADHRDPDVRERLDALVRATGAEPHTIAPGRHDALVAIFSHLPQALAVALGATAGDALTGALASDARAVAGPGFASMLRLARSAPEVWEPIFRGNATEVAIALRALAERLVRAADGLEAGNCEPLVSYFAEASAAVRATERFQPPKR